MGIESVCCAMLCVCMCVCVCVCVRECTALMYEDVLGKVGTQDWVFFKSCSIQQGAHMKKGPKNMCQVLTLEVSWHASLR